MPVYSSEDAFNRALSRVLGDDTTMLAADGTSGSTTALYRMDLSAGDILVGSEYLDQAALTDTVLIGTGAWGKSFALDGSAAVVLTADGKTFIYALVVVLVAGTPTVYAVFGDEAADGSEVAPTVAGIIGALQEVIGDSYDSKFGLITNLVKVQRAGGVITVTATDPAADDALKNMRLAGTLNL